MYLCQVKLWFFRDEIKQLLESGFTVIADRYYYSGIAYSYAKGLDLEWCKSCEDGLLKPDVVFFLDISPQIAQTRGNYGQEIFENVQFQERVSNAYRILYNENKWNEWMIFDANVSADELFERLLKCLNQILKEQ